MPLIVRWPGRLEAGALREDLVTLLDLPPTMLSLAGVEVPEHMQGRIVLGENTQREPEYLFFHRDRMDEAYELMRSARDRRYRYIRNFEPEKRYSQGIDYMDQMPAMKDWRRLHAEGKLIGPQANWFAETKPIEELYDTQEDPWELNNLASAPEHAARLAKMRRAVEQWQEEIGDLGLVPEAVLMQQMQRKYEPAKTAAPRFRLVKQDDTPKQLEITCATPGALILYRVNQRGGRVWKLYVQPLDVSKVDLVQAVACRIGFDDSPQATWKP